jgi:superfamily II DNA or RNA helicase
MEHFGIRPIKAFYSRELWKSRLEERVSALISGGLRFLAVVVVNETLASEDFQRIMGTIPRDKLFFVGDECHHHSANVWTTRTPIDARFRIGLSATPWNPGREDHRRVLEEIYGPVVASYSLRDALADGVLCQYSYEWIPCQFESEYERLSLKIATLYAQDPSGTNPGVQTQLQATAARRARLVGALRDKLRQLQRLVRQQGPVSHTLVYCGEGSHPLDDDTGPSERAVNATTQMLASMGWKVGRITAAETVAERKRILESFDDGVIDAVAAIRVLDEGFDIPS